jgi:hypothetical protein
MTGRRGGEDTLAEYITFLRFHSATRIHLKFALALSTSHLHANAQGEGSLFIF